MEIVIFSGDSMDKNTAQNSQKHDIWSAKYIFMTYNVFGGTLNLAQSNPIQSNPIWGGVGPPDLF